MKRFSLNPCSGLVWSVFVCLLVSCLNVEPGQKTLAMLGGELKIFFPRIEVMEGTPVEWEALTWGRLVLRDRCIFLEQNGAYSLPIWPPSYSLEMSGSDYLIVNSYGQVEARIGDEVDIGGGGWDKEWQPELERQIGQVIPQRCEAPFWMASSALTVR